MDVSVRDGKLYEFGPFRLDPVRRSLTRDGEPIPLSPTLFDTLLHLVENPGRVVPRDELMDAVWPRKLVEESNVSQTIFTLRKALAAAGASEPYIVTQPGRGYRFTQPVRSLTQRTAHGAAPGADGEPLGDPPRLETAPPPAVGETSRRWLPLAVAAGAAMVLVAVSVGVWLWRAQPKPAPRLVVMGEFLNLTREPLFDQTFTEATRIELTQSPYLTVLPERRVQETLALMTRSKDERLTPAISQEVCARNDGLAAVRGSLAQVGARYLMTLSAENCATGETLAAEKIEVSGRDALLPALDTLAARLRRRLGESTTSVRAFGAPIVKARTASLEALRAYSEGRHDFEHGKRADAIPLFRHAIELDPDFAAAHVDLGVVLYNLKELKAAAAQVTEAWRLSALVDPRERFFIRYQYSAIVTHDADEGVRVLRAWTGVYPGDAGAWANLANQETWLGHPLAAIDPGRRAVILEPDVEGAYVVLARAYMHAGRLQAARAVCDAAVARKVDGDDLHGVAYQLAVARGDRDAAARELDWARGKSGERSMLIEAGQDAYRLGQVRRGGALFAQAVALGKPFGLGDFTAAPNARLLYDMGLADLARESLAKVPPDFDSPDYRFSLAEFGDQAKARSILAGDLAKSPTDTLLTQVYAPEVRAALALRAGRPRDAVEALRPALPYEARTFDTPYLRGVAFLAAGDGPGAAGEFHKILDNPGVEPVSVLYALSRLGLARAESLRRDTPAARRAYEAFFADWKDADPDMPLLRAARAEYARLPRPA